MPDTPIRNLKDVCSAPFLPARPASLGANTPSSDARPRVKTVIVERDLHAPASLDVSHGGRCEG